MNARPSQAADATAPPQNRDAQRLQCLRRLVQVLAEHTSVEALAAASVEAAANAVGARRAVAYLHDEAGMPRLRACIGLPAELQEKRSVLALDAPLPLAVAIRTGLPAFYAEREALLRDYPALARSPVPDIYAIAALPLHTPEGVRGGLGFSFSESHDFPPEERDFLETIAMLCGSSLERARLVQSEARARALVERERALLHAVFMDAPACIAILEGPQHRYELSNKLNDATAGGRQLVGKTLRDALPEFEAQGLTAIIDRVYSTGEALRFTEVPASALVDGRLKQMFFNAVLQPLRDEAGNVNGIASFAFEVTDQILAKRRAEEAEATVRQLTESLPAIVWSADPKGSANYFNQRWYEYTGLPKGSVDADAWARPVHPDDLPIATAEWAAAIRDGAPFEVELRLRRASDQTYRWHLARCVPVRDAEGNVTRWFGTSVDMDDAKRAHERAEDLARELREAIRHRDEFLSVAGHELRTPLAAMLLHIQSLERTLRKESRPGRALERVEKTLAAGARLENLVNRLLDVSRIQAGRLDLELDEVDLVAVVRDVVERHSDLAAARGVAIDVDGVDSLLGVWDKTRLDQVVTNLLTNALKYGNAQPVRITVALEQNDAVLRVRDHGIGIPADAQQRIFQRFERAALSSDYGGIGLGLWITRQIVQALGGHIAVQSEAGAGSVFTVRLPTRLNDRA